MSTKSLPTHPSPRSTGRRLALRLLACTAAVAACGAALSSQADASAPVLAPRFASVSATVPVGSTTSPGGVLEVGSQGARVLAAQQRLTALGYWLGNPDGHYAELTRQAVMALQGAAGLHRDGILGPATRTALDRGVVPRVSVRTGHSVEIDRAAGTLTFADGGRVTTVLHTSTGSFQRYRFPDGRTALADTPAGSFHVYRTVDGVRVAALGRLYRPRYFDPSQGIAVHGAAHVPGYPASHGCARVTNAAMDMIWSTNQMPMGTQVVVR
ncbi:peptidoglycan-binding protein [Kineococcus sp. TBRC 1896]|uniref:Peptidoglycan-binding protein n=1 Tax=Kineococcus mangrovi TaxID=1660183 RepID=A0ABV4HYL5_9ACTN